MSICVFYLRIPTVQNVFLAMYCGTCLLSQHLGGESEGSLRVQGQPFYMVSSRIARAFWRDPISLFFLQQALPKHTGHPKPKNKNKKTQPPPMSFNPKENLRK